MTFIEVAVIDRCWMSPETETALELVVEDQALVSEGGLSIDLEQLVERAAATAKASRAPATRLAYERQFRRFEAWCASASLPSYPSDARVVVTYLQALADAGRKISTIEQALAAIAFTHRERGDAWDTRSKILVDVTQGLRRSIGVRPVQKSPVEQVELRAMVGACDESLLGLRDRALLLIGWVGAFRRSELVALDHADLQFQQQGLVVLVRHAKGDQEGHGLEKALPFSTEPSLCPVRTLQTWLGAAGITEGPLFVHLGRGNRLGGARLSDQAVAQVVKARARAAGLPAELYSGHSLRAGFATCAAAHDRPLDEIMRQTGHKSPSVAMRYIRHGSLFRKNAAAGLL